MGLETSAISVWNWKPRGFQRVTSLGSHEDQSYWAPVTAENGKCRGVNSADTLKARPEGRQAKAVLFLPQSFSRGSTGRHCPLWRASSPLVTLSEKCPCRPAQSHVSWLIPDPIKMVTKISTQGGTQVPCNPFLHFLLLCSLSWSHFFCFSQTCFPWGTWKSFSTLTLVMTSSQTWVLACCFGLFFHVHPHSANLKAWCLNLPRCYISLFLTHV